MGLSDSAIFETLGSEGSERFMLNRKLGDGGMGTVYDAYDKQRDQDVALKVLRIRNPSSLYRFKQEFRTLADVAHPNLITLYELFAGADQWFFTMELIDGRSFFEYVRPGVDQELDRERLDKALLQLALGVQALHDAGKLHRDLKPANIMVNHEGRVVILDFGLATELRGEQQFSTGGVTGTVAYMAPEQGAGEQISRASDWYSVGVILFEALTAELPFKGSLYDVFLSKMEKTPPSPADLVDGLPPEMVELTNGLLARDPSKRPAGEEILERLGVEESSSGAVNATATLVGRETQMKALEEAYRASREGQAVSLYVHGPSGMGKTTLIQFFLEGLAQEQAVVLKGRCYEREMVPYKALDGVIDSLSRYLSGLEEEDAEALRPKNYHTLLRLFPVLEPIRRRGGRRPRTQDGQDLLILRREAFEALRQLLAAIAQRQPLVLYIDDLQWADADSTVLLDDLLRPPEPPPLILISSFRSEEIGNKPFLQELLVRTGSETCRQVTVEALTDDEARELARFLLKADPAMEDCALADPILNIIVKEGDGSPFLVEQLARFVQIKRDSFATGINLIDMLEERIRRLPEGTRKMLLALTVANRSMDAAVAYAAAGLEGDERQLVASLRAASFVRSSGSAHRIEIYHDRIATTLATLLDSAEVRRIHSRLASALEARGFDDPEALFAHYLGAGDEARAADQAVLAAKKAFDALAFDPAARFYRQALDLYSTPLNPPEGTRRPDGDRSELRKGLADSLANAGRSADAAAQYLELAEDAAEVEALEARCNAAEQYLLGGFLELGLAVAQKVLKAVGLRMPSGPRGALLSLLAHRLRLRLRGLKFAERDADDVARQDLVRIDTCWAIGAGLSLADTIRGADFQTRHLLLALRAGEPYRIARALAMEASFMVSGGKPGRAEDLLRRAKALAARVDSPHAAGLATMHTGTIDYFTGRSWRRAADAYDEAARIFNEHCNGAVWEVTACRRFVLACLMYLGEIGELSRRVPIHLAEARERGNVYLANAVRCRVNIVWLAADDPREARRMIDEAQTTGAQRSFTVNEYNSWLAQVQTDLYCGEPRVAHERFLGQFPELKKSMLLRVQLVRIETLQLRARVSLALAVARGKSDELIEKVAMLADKIDAEKRLWARSWASLLRAGSAAFSGDTASSQESLRAAAAGFDDAEMALYAAVTRRRLGELSGDERLIRDADNWMGIQGIKSPERMTALLAPGFADRGA